MQKFDFRLAKTKSKLQLQKNTIKNTNQKNITIKHVRLRRHCVVDSPELQMAVINKLDAIKNETKTTRTLATKRQYSDKKKNCQKPMPCKKDKSTGINP